MVTEFLEAGWKAYKKNLGAILISNIILFAVILIIAVVAGISAIIPLMPSFMGTGSIDLMSMGASFAIAMLVLIIVSVELSGGLIGVYNQSLKGSAKVETMFDTIRKRWLPILGVAVVTGLVMLAIFAIATGIFLAMPGIAGMAIAAIVALVLGLAVAFRLILAEIAVVVSGLSTIEALESSWKAVGKGYWSLLGLVLLIFVLSFAVGVIPIVGMLISIFLVSPVGSLAMIQFYHKNAKKR